MTHTHAILLLSLLSLLTFHVQSHTSVHGLDTNDWSSFHNAIQEGELDGFFSIAQANRIIDFLYRNFPDLMLPVEVLGQSNEGRDINMYCLTKKGGDTTLKQEAKTKSIAYMTSMHHAREPLTLTMTLFFMFRSLVEYRQNNIEYVSLLDNNIACIAPLIGIDSYTYIEEHHKQTGIFKPIRKNRGYDPETKCNDDTYGVDLNRNYDYKWDQNDQTIANECDETYRGSAPFSEPETRAIKNFVESYLDSLKLVINLHTFGNYWIYPSDATTDDGTHRADRIKSIYKDFKDHAILPPNAKVGNGLSTVGYTVSGDGCDWVLGRHGIIAYNPELGLHLEEDNQFFPPKHVHYRVISENFNGLFYMFNKMNPVIKLDGAFIAYGKGPNNNNNIVNIVLFNEAYRDLYNPTLKINIGITTNDPNFAQSAQPIVINAIEKSLDINVPSNTTSINTSYTKKIMRDEDLLIYPVEKQISFKSWNLMHLETVLPAQGYEEVYIELEIYEKGRKVYSYWADFEGKKVMRRM